MQIKRLNHHPNCHISSIQMRSTTLSRTSKRSHMTSITTGLTTSTTSLGMQAEKWSRITRSSRRSTKDPCLPENHRLTTTRSVLEVAMGLVGGLSCTRLLQREKGQRWQLRQCVVLIDLRSHLCISHH